MRFSCKFGVLRTDYLSPKIGFQSQKQNMKNKNFYCLFVSSKLLEEYF